MLSIDGLTYLHIPVIYTIGTFMAWVAEFARYNVWCSESYRYAI